MTSSNVTSNATGLSTFSAVITQPIKLQPRSVTAFVNNDTSPTPASQNTPAAFNSSETGFYNTAFPSQTVGGNLSLIGLADAGSRLEIGITTVPTGTTINAPTVVTYGTQGVARLVQSGGGQQSACYAFSFGGGSGWYCREFGKRGRGQLGVAHVRHCQRE